jgi:hypothetical protein
MPQTTSRSTGRKYPKGKRAIMEKEIVDEG